MSLGDQNKVDGTNDPSKFNNNAGMGGSSKWKMVPQIIISSVTSKTQYGNLTRRSLFRQWIQTLLVFVQGGFHLWLIQMEIRRIDTLELFLTCFSFHTKAYYPPIRSVLPVTYMTTIYINLEGGNGWWPRMTGKVAFLSLTDWSTYMLDAQPMNRWSNIPRWPLFQLGSGSHQI